jgi:PKD repeat protein
MSTGESRVVKSYKQGGNYKILLTVSSQNNNSCNTSTIEKIVRINEPPHAQAGREEILRCVTGPEDMVIDFDASATTDANNDLLSYLWDFGDGTEERGKEASHRYQTIGIYDAKLIVSDNTNLQCGTSVDFVTVKFNKAPVADAGTNAVVCTGDNVTFDGSASWIDKKGTETAQWFFGDGSAKLGLKTEYRYNQPGIYQATLSIENTLNKMCPISRDTRTVTVNSPPIVSIKNLPSQCAGKTVFFDASSAIDSDGDPLNYFWNFGDGSSSQAGAKVSHRYDQGGNYRVSVVVDDQKGTSCSTATAQTNVRINTPPLADAGPNHACCVNKSASFSASGSSDPDSDQLNYAWDFGDGTKTLGENVNHAYTREGSYNVILTVNDQSETVCGKSTDQFVATVKDGPLPVITVR